MKDKTKEHLEQLSEIRDMMKESTQFLSLSGMSGVFAGYSGACWRGIGLDGFL